MNQQISTFIIFLLFILICALISLIWVHLISKTDDYVNSEAIKQYGVSNRETRQFIENEMLKGGPF